MSSHTVRGLEQIRPTRTRQVGDHVSTTGGEMSTDPLELPFRERDSVRQHAIEIVAPDRYCTTLLLEHAAPHFPAQVVYGAEFANSPEPADNSGWIVRLEPPAERDWALDLLSLVERWLESCRLPCAKVLYGGRSYLIRASTDGAWFQGAAESKRGFSGP
jgi:hypothetical protein